MHLVAKHTGSGERSTCTKGMAKEFSKSFYKSKAWQRCRAYVWKRDGGMCADCMANGIITAGVEVHHIIELTPANINDPSISLNPDNLVTLCKSCHEKRHGKKNKRYKVDELGRVKAR